VAAILRSVDPRDVSAVDSLLEGIEGIEDQVCCAVSIACFKAGARHRGISLYKYFSEICQIGNIILFGSFRK
jgi:enolase